MRVDEQGRVITGGDLVQQTLPGLAGWVDASFVLRAHRGRLRLTKRRIGTTIKRQAGRGEGGSVETL